MRAVAVLALLQRRWFFAAAVCLGVLLMLPALATGFVADDYLFIHRLELRDFGRTRHQAYRMRGSSHA